MYNDVSTDVTDVYGKSAIDFNFLAFCNLFRKSAPQTCPATK
jgi:hypothetical protein